MHSVIELHDSVVTHCEERNDSIVFRLSPAWLHRAATKPGYEAGDVFTLDVDVVLRFGTFRLPFIEIPTKLSDGFISVAGDRFDNCVPFPLDLTGAVTVALVDHDGRNIELSAQSISLVAASDETYVEAFPGNNA